MADNISQINTFWKRYRYQQITYLKLIWTSTKAFLSHFPLGYVNLLIQTFLSIISFPIYLGHALEFWMASMLIIKPTLEDVGNMSDAQQRSIVAKAQIRAIEDYKEIIKTLITFLLGVITTVVTLYFTTRVFRGR